MKKMTHWFKKEKKNLATDEAKNKVKSTTSIAAEHKSQGPKKAITWQAEGEGHYQQRTYDQALACFQKAFEMDKQLIESCYRIGCILLETKEFEKAIDYFNQTLMLNKDYIGAWNKKGMAFFILQQFSDALRCYENALQLDSNSHTVWINKGKLHAHCGEFDEAIHCFGEANTLKKDLVSVWVELANAYMNQQKFLEALGWYEKAHHNKSIGQLRLPVLKGKGIAHFFLGNFLEAHNCFDQFLKEYGQESSILMYKGDALLHQGRYDAALKFYDEAKRIDALFEGTHHRGLALRLLGRLDDAHQFFQALTVASTEVEKSKLLYQLGVILFLRKNFEEANQYFDSVSSHSSEYAWVLQVKGVYSLYQHQQNRFLTSLWSLVGNNYQQAAHTYFKQAEELITAEPSLTKKAHFFTERGLLLLSLGSLEEAKLAFEQAMAYLPHYIPTKQGLDAYQATKNAISEQVSLEKLNSLDLCIPFHQIKLEESIARGGFGEVFKGQSFKSPAAIKQLLSTLDVQQKEAFKREALMMAKLRHPNVVQIYGIVVDKEPYLLVMEWMEKKSLYLYLHTRSPSTSLIWPVREKIAKDIACGLNYLHNQNIVHRDLKSHNVLLTDNFNAKIGDFGLAETKEMMKNKNSEIAGTLAWIAPEIWQGKNFTEKSDMYSYAMTLWELASCQLPFKGKTQERLLQWVVDEQKREEIPPDCPPLIRKIITQCWQASPDARLSAEEALKLFPT